MSAKTRLPTTRLTWKNHENHRQKRTVSLWKRQEIQEVSWRAHDQVRSEGKRSAGSFRLPALRGGARNFTMGGGNDEESFPPVAHRYNPRRGNPRLPLVRNGKILTNNAKRRLRGDR